MLLRVHHSPHFETIGCWICIAVRTYGRADLVFVRSPRRRSADGRPLLLSALVSPALGTGADPFPETTVPTEWTIFSHAVASTRRGQLPPVRASSESSLRRRKPTELVSGFGGRRTRLVSTKLLHPRHLAPRSRPHATETTPPIIMRVACAHVANGHDADHPLRRQRGDLDSARRACASLGARPDDEPRRSPA